MNIQLPTTTDRRERSVDWAQRPRVMPQMRPREGWAGLWQGSQDEILAAAAYGRVTMPHREIRDDSGKWSGVNTMDDALTLAVHGWQEGADAAMVLFDAARSKHTRSFVPMLTLADEPGEFDPASYYSGEERFFVSHTSSERLDSNGQGQALSIEFEAFLSYVINANDALRRGIAVAALAYMVERAGIRTEIVWRTRTIAQDRVGADEVRFTLKSYAEPLDLPRVCYWLAHPSAFRMIAMGGVLSPWHGCDSYPNPQSFNEKHDKATPEKLYVSGYTWSTRLDHSKKLEETLRGLGMLED